MINTADITKEIVRTLVEHSEISGHFQDVERGEYVNKDPSRTPWVGVYRTKVGYVPKVLGQHSLSWQALLTVKLVVQAHAATGPESEDACENAVQRVMTAMLENLSLSGKVGTLKSVDVEYSYDETESSTLDFQWAFITLIYETRTGV